MSLVDSSHIETARRRGGTHYKIINGKPGMIMNPAHYDNPGHRACGSCHREFDAWEPMAVGATRFVACPSCGFLTEFKR